MTSDLSSSEADAVRPSAGRWIRLALFLFPAGTVLLGIASFGIWKWKGDRVEDRNYQFAVAMRRAPTAEGWERHLKVLTEVAMETPPQRMASTASYVESSTGAESMGYLPVRQRFSEGGMEVAGIQIELTGKRRPRELVELLIPYGSVDGGQMAAENRALATVLTLAHGITGESVDRTLRIAAVPLRALSRERQVEALQVAEAAGRQRDERLMHLFVMTADGQEDAALEEVLKEGLRLDRQGAVLHWLPVVDGVEAALEQVDELRATLLSRASAPG